MGLKWTDIQEIAIQLNDSFPEVEPQSVNFPNLYKWVLELDEFDDDPRRCGERILEAIQQAWLDEKS
jgi:FeS assembly protein IscX